MDGVKVTITNTETGVSIVRTTNSAGIYDAPSVPIGEYKMTFSKSGFRDFVRQGVTLQLQTLGIDATLQVGAATIAPVGSNDNSLSVMAERWTISRQRPV